MQPNGSETVLVVDDCPRVRTACARTLREAGYEVLEAGFAEQALRVWARRADEIALVLTDVMMPGRSGVALVEEMRRERPALRVVFMSAYPDEILRDRGFDCGGAPLLHKPFAAPGLRDLVAQVAHPDRAV